MNAAFARFASPFIRTSLLVLALIVPPATSSASVFVSVGFAPPPLPVYVQPVVPGPDYIWIPGYWAYGPEGYYWVPGTWVLAPYIGALWTPGYWGWGDAAYTWYPGYWGPRVGYYGGINYGFGYFGVGYHGGYWRGRVFNYNTAVTNVNVTYIHNTYNAPVAQNAAVTRVSFNGGAGGINARPTAEERLAERDRHQPATQVQVRHAQLASTNRAQLASVNQGSPAVTATPRVSAFRQQNAGAAGTGAPGTTAPRITREAQGTGAPGTGAPRVTREARIERGYSQPSGGGGHPKHMAQPQQMAQPQRIAPQQTQPQHTAPPRSMQPQAMTQPQNMPRPQAHAQNVPHPQGQPQRGHDGEHREEGRNR